MSKAGQRKEKKHWAIEKPKLRHARQLRGIHQIDPDDMEFKNTMKNARKKLEVPLESAMPCRIAHGHGETWCTHNKSCKTRYACVIEALDSTKTRIRRTQRKDHEDLLVREAVKSLVSRLPFAELRRLFSTVSKLSRSVCGSGCIRTEEWKKTVKDRSK